MVDTPDALGGGPATRSGTAYMIVGTLLAALGAYGFQVIAARSLGSTAFAPIAVLWTVQFLAFTTLFLPMEQLTIRRLNAHDPSGPPWRLFLSVIVAAAALAVAFAAITLDRLLDGDAAYLITVAALVVGYGGFALGRGYLAGNRRFREYGIATFAESALRLVLAAIILAVGIGTVGLAWTLVAGSIVVYAFRPFRSDRGRAADVGRGTTAALAAFVGATSASQTLLAAGPLVVGALGGSRAQVSIVFETFLLFRAPLTIGYSLIARVLPPFTAFVEAGARAELRSWAIRLGGLGAAAGAAGFITAYLIGPVSVEFLLGQEFRPTSHLAAHAASGIAIATVALFTQQILIALQATHRLAAAWITGLGAATMSIALSGSDPVTRVAVGFLIGEAVAFTLIVLATLVTINGRRP